eukprot:CAMPEP_0202894108 /NCGR_PEP_ID=MMETSP1392-20130828/3557_1 /ASSEMBLY_ACC=CAM_ASM_000868 /TAXON_ID=225041 /ORGANISM="Chlamydomonas chlamydogama, Strain SAG 11-48b" /LENGTH=159 /DNA_ID=CAMNT_0049578677 /DNA_START=58 /DNA_END=537 /DNA_ORIENTATION=-
MSALSLLKSKSTGACRVARCSNKTPRVRSVVCRAEDNPDAAGFVAKDSAGQANLYPVLTKAYEAGSAADSGEASAANTTYAIAAAGVALGLIGAGLVALTSGSADPAALDAAEFRQYASLSEYSSKFSSELGLGKKAPAPAPAVVAEAPAAEESPAAEN